MADRPRVLFVYAHGVPAEKGPSSADRVAFARLKVLAARAEVDGLCFLPRRHASDDPALETLRAVCRELTALPVPSSPLSGALRWGGALLAHRSGIVAVKTSGPAAATFNGLLAARRYGLVYAHSPLSLANFPASLPAANRPRVVVEVLETLWASLRSYREFPVRAAGWKVAVESRQWRAMQDFERGIYTAADLVVCLSERESGLIRELDPEIRTACVPLSVDGREFTPPDRPDARTEPLLLYTGNFIHAANTLAVREAVRSLLPLVAQCVPAVRLAIVGHGAARAVGRFSGERVRVVDAAPSLVPHYQQAAAVVGPIRTGEGVRGKFLESLACGCPVVTTPLGASGIAVRPEEGLLVGETVEELANQTVRALTDAAFRRAVNQAAPAAIRRHHGHEVADARLRQILAPYLDSVVTP